MDCFKFSKPGAAASKQISIKWAPCCTGNKFVMTSFGGDWFLSKDYVGRKIVFGLEYKDYKAIATDYVFVFSDITPVWDRDWLL